MPLLSKHVWTLPDGNDYVTWRVSWTENGHPRRKPFSNSRDAVAFMAKLALDLKQRKAFARTWVGVDRVVRPRAVGAKVIPFRRRH
jgi:hypothetical protein